MKLIAQNYSNTTTNRFTITVEELSLVRIYPSTSITMNLLSSYAGESMAPATNSSSYLQMTNIIPSWQSRVIQATISFGTVPSGTLLTLSVGSCTSGAGNRGTAISSSITLNSTSNQTIVSGIKSAYTGTGINDGYNLKYTWKVDPAHYNLLHATTSESLTITYTISSN